MMSSVEVSNQENIIQSMKFLFFINLFIASGFYKRHKRTKDWSPEETIKFYRSLQAVGTDFSVMLQLFPNRTRRDLKLKFKKEEKHNMALINKALLHPKEFNIEELKLQFDEEDRDLEAKKQEWTELSQSLSSERKEQLNKTKKKSAKRVISASVRSMTDGDKIYENEFIQVSKPKRRKQNVCVSFGFLSLRFCSFIYLNFLF